MDNSPVHGYRSRRRGNSRGTLFGETCKIFTSEQRRAVIFEMGKGPALAEDGRLRVQKGAGR